tara:strand:+ start:1360 stop:1524 length:165 start_codon:yes stop_codon:yes gene_type:complete
MERFHSFAGFISDCQGPVCRLAKANETQFQPLVFQRQTIKRAGMMDAVAGLREE